MSHCSLILLKSLSNTTVPLYFGNLLLFVVCAQLVKPLSIPDKQRRYSCHQSSACLIAWHLCRVVWCTYGAGIKVLSKALPRFVTHCESGWLSFWKYKEASCSANVDKWNCLFLPGQVVAARTQHSPQSLKYLYYNYCDVHFAWNPCLSNWMHHWGRWRRNLLLLTTWLHLVHETFLDLVWFILGRASCAISPFLSLGAQYLLPSVFNANLFSCSFWIILLSRSRERFLMVTSQGFNLITFEIQLCCNNN